MFPKSFVEFGCSGATDECGAQGSVALFATCAQTAGLLCFNFDSGGPRVSLKLETYY